MHNNRIGWIGFETIFTFSPIAHELSHRDVTALSQWKVAKIQYLIIHAFKCEFINPIGFSNHPVSARSTNKSDAFPSTWASPSEAVFCTWANTTAGRDNVSPKTVKK